MLDPRVETFLTVCETMNFTKAASLLHLSQPTLSRQLSCFSVLPAPCARTRSACRSPCAKWEGSAFCALALP